MTIALSRTMFSLLFAISVLFEGCTTNDQSDQMLEKTLKNYELHPSHRAVQEVTIQKLQTWIDSGVEDVQVLKECEWKLDKGVFFNTQKNRAYMLLLIQDNLPNAEMDYVYVLYAALERNNWVVYFAGLPNLVFPRAQLNHQPISWVELSKLAKEELRPKYLHADGRVNDEFVDQAYTADLKAKQSKFLTKKSY